MTQSIAAIIVGIEGWQKYTKPLIESIVIHEPDCGIVLVDNESNPPYPDLKHWRNSRFEMTRVDRLCYSAAINWGKRLIYGSWADWIVVLSNDVLCTGPFAHILEQYSDGDVVGPALKETHGWHYIEGWCVAIPRQIWDAVGGWDERFLGSDWEDVAFSTRARQLGFGLVEDLPFIHLDQKQRYHIVDDFWAKDAHNRNLFMREYAQAVAA